MEDVVKGSGKFLKLAELMTFFRDKALPRTVLLCSSAPLLDLLVESFDYLLATYVERKEEERGRGSEMRKEGEGGGGGGEGGREYFVLSSGVAKAERAGVVESFNLYEGPVRLLASYRILVHPTSHFIRYVLAGQDLLNSESPGAY